jgi:hypothetical protein
VTVTARLNAVEDLPATRTEFELSSPPTKLKLVSGVSPSTA